MLDVEAKGGTKSHECWSRRFVAAVLRTREVDD
jgi:hypothetical protein